MLTREQRLKDREVRRILHEEDLAKIEQSGSESGDRRLSERQQKSELERKQKEVEQIKRELSQADDHWDFDCSICGVHGKDMVNEPPSIQQSLAMLICVHRTTARTASPAKSVAYGSTALVTASNSPTPIEKTSASSATAATRSTPSS